MLKFELEITSPNPVLGIFLNPDLGPNVKFIEWATMCAAAGY